MPTLVFHTRDDPIGPCDQGRLLASLVPSSRYVELQREPPVDRRRAGMGALCDELDRFLRGD